MGNSENKNKSDPEEEVGLEAAGRDERDYEESPPWSQNVKILVVVASLVLVVAVVGRFTDLILRIVAAGIIAYVLTPLINVITERSPLKRGAAIAVTYTLLILLLIGFFVVLGVSTFQQVQNLIEAFPTLVDNVASRIAAIDVIKLGPLDINVAETWGAIDWTGLENQI
ncbi:MAG: AI-2E family transporter, partial [Chloroflexota bacterium]